MVLKLPKQYFFLAILWRLQQSWSTANPNITGKVNHNIMNNKIYLRSVMRAVTCIHKIVITNLDLLLTSPPKNCKYYNNLRTKTHEENMRTRQMTPFFHQF